MIYKVAEFTVKSEEVNAVKHAIDSFVSQVQKNEPDTLMYESMPMGENGFVHFMAFKDEAAQTHHSQTQYVHDFVEILYPRCDREPIFVELFNESTET